ncbi:MAG: hypothetical protein H6728_17740 [Myxococcales bacterium]|nr:hypothetical protein [Myxococcales bacterium]MCB9644918.1 hypothetical protein [Myxococcales bacterium]
MSTKIPQGTRPAAAPQPEIVCPVIRGIVDEGHLPIDAKGNAKISDLKEVFEDLGLSRNAAYVAAVGNSPGRILGNLWKGTFNVNQLRGGLLDHSGDSLILRNGHFDPERFQALVSHSSDGKTMSMEDFRAAIRDNKQIDDASWIGSKISGVEFSLLLNVFGEKGPDGQKRVSIDDLRGLYEDKRLPGAKLGGPIQTAPETPVATMASVARSLPSESPSGLARAGVDSAVQGSDLFGAGGLAAKGAGQGVCAFMQGGGAQTTSDTNAQVTQQHNQLPLAAE